MIRSFILSLLLIPFALGSEKENILDAKLTHVTVFSDRAEVVRSAQVDLGAGEHTLVFNKLPAQTDTGSLQVSGTGGFVLQDVRFQTRYLSELPAGRLKELTDEREKTQASLKTLDMADGRLKEQRGALEAVISRVTKPPKESTEPVIMDPEQWGKLLAFYAAQLEALDKSAAANADTRKQLNAETARIQSEINQLNANARRVDNTAKVQISLQAASKITVELKSIVHGPRWTPLYDLRADTQAREVAICAYASITQASGESWDNVQLRLSTAQPQIGGREPSLSPWFLQDTDPALQRAAKDLQFSITTEAKRDRTSNMMNQMHSPNLSRVSRIVVDDPEAQEMKQPQADVQSGASAVLYTIPGSVSIPSNNQPVRVTITTQTFAGHLRHSAVPKLSPHVYLKAKVINTSQYAFLPGSGNIYLDGTFVGKAPVDLVQPTQEFWIWLGVDQGVSVKRKLLERKESERGLFGKGKRLNCRYEFEIKNNKQTPVELVLWDQLPIAPKNTISVELVQPKYSSDTDTLKMNSQKYIEWLYQLAPGQEIKTPFEFQVSWPEGTQIWGI